MASYVENVSIWWRHHESRQLHHHRRGWVHEDDMALKRFPHSSPGRKNPLVTGLVKWGFKFFVVASSSKFNPFFSFYLLSLWYPSSLLWTYKSLFVPKYFFQHYQYFAILRLYIKKMVVFPDFYLTMSKMALLVNWSSHIWKTQFYGPKYQASLNYLIDGY